MRRFLLLTMFMLCSVAYGSEVLAVEITRGLMLSNSCAACHGPDGKSPGAIPSINGKSVQFLLHALYDFKSGKRATTVMGRHASGYSDEELRHIADYFSSRP